MDFNNALALTNLVGTFKEQMLEGKTKDKTVRYRNKVGLWYSTELVIALKVGYTVVMVVHLKHKTKREIVEINSVEEFNYLLEYSFIIEPRYIHYKDKVYMHIENFEMLAPKNYLYNVNQNPTPKVVHEIFYNLGRMTLGTLRELLDYENKKSQSG